MQIKLFELASELRNMAAISVIRCAIIAKDALMAIAGAIGASFLRLVPCAVVAGVSIVLTAVAVSAARIAFLPFKDLVRLKESWDLSVDVPRYFSQTVDTIGMIDSAVQIAPFDSVRKLIEDNAWSREVFLSEKGLKKIGAVLQADFLVCGTISEFKVSKITLNTDAPLNASTDFGANISGSGGVTVMGGLQSYGADIAMSVDIYNAKTGARVEHLPLSSKEKDSGFKLFLPVQRENPEMDFYYMSRSPFGSIYFQRSVPGAVMKQFSLTLKRRFQIAGAASSPAPADTLAKEYLSGRVLERAGNDVYIDLGTADRMLHGEILEVMKPAYPLIGQQGDTLGWAEKRVGAVKVRFVKAQHFSIATIVDETDSITTRCSVRSQIEELKKE